MVSLIHSLVLVFFEEYEIGINKEQEVAVQTASFCEMVARSQSSAPLTHTKMNRKLYILRIISYHSGWLAKISWKLNKKQFYHQNLKVTWYSNAPVKCTCSIIHTCNIYNQSNYGSPISEITFSDGIRASSLKCSDFIKRFTGT